MVLPRVLSTATYISPSFAGRWTYLSENRGQLVEWRRGAGQCLFSPGVKPGSAVSRGQRSLHSRASAVWRLSPCELEPVLHVFMHVCKHLGKNGEARVLSLRVKRSVDLGRILAQGHPPCYSFVPAAALFPFYPEAK